MKFGVLVFKGISETINLSMFEVALCIPIGSKIVEILLGGAICSVGFCFTLIQLEKVSSLLEFRWTKGGASQSICLGNPC